MTDTPVEFANAELPKIEQARLVTFVRGRLPISVGLGGTERGPLLESVSVNRGRIRHAS